LGDTWLVELSDTSTLLATFCCVSPSCEAMTRSTSIRNVGWSVIC
jgi:hypothetical protein